MVKKAAPKTGARKAPKIEVQVTQEKDLKNKVPKWLLTKKKGK